MDASAPVSGRQPTGERHAPAKYLTMTSGTTWYLEDSLRHAGFVVYTWQ